MARVISLGDSNIVPYRKTILPMTSSGATKRCLPSHKVHEVEKGKPIEKVVQSVVEVEVHDQNQLLWINEQKAQSFELDPRKLTNPPT
jgi:hypothetical protein